MVQVAVHHVADVGEQDVARPDSVRAEVVNFGLEGIGEAADEHGQPDTGGDRLAGRIEQPDGEILYRVDAFAGWRLGRASEYADDSGLELVHSDRSSAPASVSR